VIERVRRPKNASLSNLPEVSVANAPIAKSIVATRKYPPTVVEKNTALT